MGRLDYQSRKEFETSLGTDPPPLKDLIDFLEKKCITLESMQQNTKQTKGDSLSTHSQKYNSPVVRRTSNLITSKFACRYCGKKHFVNQCEQFLRLGISQRIAEIKKKNLCLNCLRGNHQTHECKASGCNFCNSRKHHSLLHQSDNNNIGDKAPSTPTQEKESKVTATHCIPRNETRVILSTAIVLVSDSMGNYKKCRALLDAGSQLNLLSEAMCRRLNLNTVTNKVEIFGIDRSCTRTSDTVEIKIKSLCSQFQTRINCSVIGRITSDLPMSSIDVSRICIPSHVKLADPKFETSGSIDLLLSAEIFWNLLKEGRIKIAEPNLFLINTLLGWIVGGSYSDNYCKQSKSFTCNLLTSNRDGEVKEIIERFWLQEELYDDDVQSRWSKEEIECEEHFVRTFRRDDKDGRFIVKLPFKGDAAQLGDSSNMALKRFLSLERKFRKDEQFKISYANAIDEAMRLGFVEKINESETNTDDTFYLPHSGVQKLVGDTRKTRVVYDGSAKSSNGFSLNDNLMTGPNLQNELFTMLIVFRTHQIAYTCDMEKMFLQIKVNEEHLNYQRFFWRSSEEHPVEIFRLLRLVFGLKNSPFTAMRCVRQLALETAIEFPVASAVLQDNVYMDDILGGAGDLQSAIELRDQLNLILGRGGFSLSKWASNNPKVLPEATSSDISSIEFNRNESTKVLGLWWNPSDDSFKFKVSTPEISGKLTKRQILSSIAKLFDPLGIVAPVIVKAKIIMQQLWTLKTGWDDDVPVDLRKLWEKYLSELKDLNQLRVPRKILPKATNEIDLLVFCDASLQAFGATLYLRIKNKAGDYSTTLVCCKSRISPLKVISLPRLELNAALLGARLMNKVSKVLGFNIRKKYYFTDSTIVLHYIAAEPSVWQIYVANRVSQIQKLTDIKEWHHVESKHNPADLVSRGTYPKQIIDSKLYWHGPEFISRDEREWPKLKIQPNLDLEQLPEKRKVVLASFTIAELPVMTKYSSFTKLQRVIAYALRFCYNARNKTQKRYGSLSNQELIAARNTIIKSIQKIKFRSEYLALTDKQPINKTSKLYNLDPFLDDDGLIRLGGRLRNAPITFDKKYPIVLPSDHQITLSLISLEHITLMHAGPMQTLASMRNKFWPLRGKQVVRKVIRGCVSCFRSSPQLAQQKMGNLPRDRLEPCKPFLKVGLDYFGPIYLTQGKRSKTKIKAWVALFVCMVTRAVHLEVVSDLTSESFLDALRRLVARRGKISVIYCDNAKTFVGAEGKLDDLLKFLLKDETQANLYPYLSSQKINWKFIPPRSPNFGGLWERLVRSAKQHMKRVIMNASLTFGEAATLMTQIEAVINSRPLAPLSSDPSDLQVITPAHFLIGESLMDIPDREFTDVPGNRLRRWQRIQQLKQHFWKRWQKEVLSQLQSRQKWCNASPPIQEGAMVLVSDENLPPLMWKLGRVEEIFPGEDGIARVASVRTNQGIYKRSVRKLAVLPLDPSGE